MDDDTANLPPPVGEPPLGPPSINQPVAAPPEPSPGRQVLASDAAPGAPEPAGPVKPDWIQRDANVNGWQVVKKLGEGGMGAVYQVRHLTTGTVAALKVSLQPANESEEQRKQRVARFGREFASVLQLDHPNLLPMMAYFLWPDPRAGHPAFVMPFVEGATLIEHCRKASPSLRALLATLLAPVADALDYIHEHELCHRDLKPANIMVQADGTPLIMDFGIAKSKASQTVTQVEVLTTFNYGAPEYLAYISSEQRLGAEPESFRYQPSADMFCLGATFYELLTGHLPYQHVPGVELNRTNLSDTFRQALSSFQPLPPSRLNPAVPPEVDALFLTMMAPDPSQRFATGLAGAGPVRPTVNEAVEALLKSVPAPHPLLDVPFTPPARVPLARSPEGAADTKEGRRGRAGRSPSPPAAPGVPPFVQPLTGPGPAAGGFRAPLEAPPATPPKQPDRDALPTGIRAARARVEATGRSSRRWLGVATGCLGAVFLVGILTMVATQAPSAEVAKPRSLLDEKEAVPAMPPPAATPALVAPPPSPVPEAARVETQPPQSPAPAPHPAVPGPAGADARAVEEMLAREYGGQRPVVPGPGGKPAPAMPKKVASWIQGDAPATGEAAPANKPLGIPLGAEIPVRLSRPLDTRTTASGPAVAKLVRPFALRGAIALPSGTTLYGKATGTQAGRFDVAFSRLRLPDGREVAFEGIAYDGNDRKPGLRASQRIVGVPVQQGPGVAEKVARGTAGVLLGKVAGSDVADVARGAGQTVLEGSSTQSGGVTADALLLDEATDFVVFAGAAF